MFEQNTFGVLGAALGPAKSLSIGATLGVEAWQIFEIEAPNGNDLDTFNTYAKPVVGISGSVKF